MIFRRCVFLTAIFSATIVGAVAPDTSSPNIQGRWKVLSFVEDGKPVAARQLQDAYVDITKELMVFHFPAKPSHPDIHMKYEFVPDGIDLRITSSSELDGPAFSTCGKWNRADGRFQFAFFNIENSKSRPPVAPAKAVIFLELRPAGSLE